MPISGYGSGYGFPRRATPAACPPPGKRRQIARGLQLSEWLTRARSSSPPARLVLSGRIIEQAANWADVSVVKTAARSHRAGAGGSILSSVSASLDQRIASPPSP